ncbi:MAG: hypothetical protein M3305_12020 [Actinomycetota bacterium]|nr:hypothetical protein [Actinomycetota bacterium]
MQGTLSGLAAGRQGREASRRSAPREVETVPLGAYGIEASLQPGLLLGYAAFSEEEISPKG